MNSEQTYCGYVALIGRPNVGKSTLLNVLVGQRVSITSHKKQTTRHVIHGIKTQGPKQIVYVDTPGIHNQSKRALNQYMNRVARHAINDVDVVVFLVSAEHWSNEDELVLEQLKRASCPVILAVNKVDMLSDKEQLLIKLEKLAAKMNFVEVVPLSAKKRHNVDTLEKIITRYLPKNPHFFLQDQITDRDDAFIFAEVIREKLFKYAHQEVPYSTTVTIEQVKKEKKLIRIDATIYVEKAGQKSIIIGKDGAKLKQVGREARLTLQHWLGKKVFLQLWVKVKSKWADDERSLRSLGFD